MGVGVVVCRPRERSNPWIFFPLSLPFEEQTRLNMGVYCNSQTGERERKEGRDIDGWEGRTGGVGWGGEEVE